MRENETVPTGCFGRVEESANARLNCVIGEGENGIGQDAILNRALSVELAQPDKQNCRLQSFGVARECPAERTMYYESGIDLFLRRS